MAALTTSPTDAWTPTEDDILITSREATEIPIPYSEIQNQLPLHTEEDCRARYVIISNRPLFQAQQANVGNLWMTHQNPLFALRAKACGVTIRSYERVSFCWRTAHPQSPLDVGRINFHTIIEDYKLNRRKIWRILSSEVVGTSWLQVEASWMRNDGKFGRLMKGRVELRELLLSP